MDLPCTWQIEKKLTYFRGPAGRCLVLRPPWKKIENQISNRTDKLTVTVNIRFQLSAINLENDRAPRFTQKKKTNVEPKKQLIYVLDISL